MLQGTDELGVPSLPLSEIVAGPKLNSQVAIRAVKFLLRQRQFAVDQEEVRPSTVRRSGQPIVVWGSATSYR